MGSESDEVQIDDSDESLDLRQIDDLEFDIPHVTPPTLESILWDMESEGSDNTSLSSLQSMSSKSRSMLYHCILKGLSSQILSAGERVGAGSPTTITNGAKYIAVGTSHGYIFAFDCEQSLCWYCHDTVTSDQGAVSALFFNMDSTRLLVGYERGFISMLDASSGDVLRRMPDAHAPQTAVLHLRFTFLNNLALCGDSSGCVFSLVFNRRLGIRTWDSKCLFSGARGEVCVFEPLLRGYDMNFLSRNVLVAMATLSKVIVISIRPKLKVLFSQQLPRSCTSLPLISWQLVSVGKTFQPVLAWGRGHELNYTRVITHGFNNNRIRLIPLRAVQLPYTMTALHWLGTRHLAILDTSENLRLIAVRHQRELEVLDVASAGLVYTSAHFKALAVGGGVSEAFALAGELACYNSLCSRGDQLLVLGTRAVHMVRLRSWPERLSYLGEQGRWAEALDLAASALEEGGGKERGAAQLLERYLESLRRDGVGVDREGLAAAVNCCVKLNKIDMLCNELLEAVSSDGNNEDWYYTLLTDHICDGTLRTLNPSVAQKVVTYLEGKDPPALEKVLLTLEVACLDLHQALRICRHLKLYNAWIHITTSTLGDYAAPLEEFLDELTPDNHKLGNVMLVYVSSCLAGAAYPPAGPPLEDAARARRDVLRSLETAHSARAAPDEPAFPLLRALLRFDARETLNVVGMAFEEAEFRGEMGRQKRRRLAGIVAGIVEQPEFSATETVRVACFVARLVASGSIDADDALLQPAVATLVAPHPSLPQREHAERQQAWLELLRVGGAGGGGAEAEAALAARCYRVAERLFEERGEFGRVVECYLRDPERQMEAFAYVAAHAGHPQRQALRQFREHFAEMAAVSGAKAAAIVAEHFPELAEEFGAKLDDVADVQFGFLGELVKAGVKLPPAVAERYLGMLCERAPAEAPGFLRAGLCRPEAALEIARRAGAAAATAWLLERGGEWAEALGVLLRRGLVAEGVELCVRGAEHLDAEDAQTLWLTLLQHPRTSSTVSIRQLLQAAAPHVPPAQLIELIADASFGDVRELLGGMLQDDRRSFMLATAMKILSKDLHLALVKTLTSHGKGVSVPDPTCPLCRKPLLSRGEPQPCRTAIAWSCGHCCHAACVGAAEGDGGCPRCRVPAVRLPRPAAGGQGEGEGAGRAARPDLEGHF